MPVNPLPPAQPYVKIAVIGAGAWGTALASVAVGAGRNVVLWAREAEVVESIRTNHENTMFLAGLALPPNLEPTTDLAFACRADAVLIASPAQFLRATLQAVRPHLKTATPVVLCAKGIEIGSGKLVTEILAEEAPLGEPAVLSGPSFARDAAQGLPTLVAVGAREDIALRLQASFGSAPGFRPYITDDLTGVALGGAAKNVYAIGCGMVDGAGYGESARAGLIARGFAEVLRLGTAIGGRPETLMGLSGLGDLVLTATSMSSRNFAFGAAIGNGKTLGDLLAPGRPLAEGAATASALVARGQRHGVEMPVAEAVADVVAGTLDVAGAAERLLSRPVGME